MHVIGIHFTPLTLRERVEFLYLGLMQPQTLHRIFFLFVAMQKERISAKKEKHAVNPALLCNAKTEWMELNADAFNLFSLTIALRARSATGRRPV